MVDFLRKTCGFDYTEEEIFRVIGILRTNAFHIQVKVMVDFLVLAPALFPMLPINAILDLLSFQDPIMKRYNVGGRAIYPTFSFLSHSYCLLL